MIVTVERRYPEEIHRALWRASQLVRGDGKFIGTGYASLSAELPGGRLAGCVTDWSRQNTSSFRTTGIARERNRSELATLEGAVTAGYGKDPDDPQAVQCLVDRCSGRSDNRR